MRKPWPISLFVFVADAVGDRLDLSVSVYACERGLGRGEQHSGGPVLEFVGVVYSGQAHFGDGGGQFQHVVISGGSFVFSSAFCDHEEHALLFHVAVVNALKA